MPHRDPNTPAPPGLISYKYGSYLPRKFVAYLWIANVPFIVFLLHSTNQSAEHTVDSRSPPLSWLNVISLDTLFYVNEEGRLSFADEDTMATKEQSNVILFLQGPILLLLDR